MDSQDSWVSLLHWTLWTELHDWEILYTGESTRVVLLEHWTADELELGVNPKWSKKSMGGDIG